MGPEVKQLEDRLAHYVKRKHAIACASGMDALLLALMAYDIGPGDAPVVVTSSQRAKEELGWLPRYNSIEEIIESAWKWHKNHTNGYT